MSLISDLIANAGGITPAFTKDSPVGAAVQGQITKADVMQSNNFDTGKPEFWDDNSPKQQLRVVIQTGQIDPMIQDDNGERAIYVKWWGDQRLALLEAVKLAGDTDVRVGGWFGAQFTGTRPNEKNPRLNDFKIYAYRYQQPAQSAGLDMNGQVPGNGGQYGGQPVQQQQAPAPQQQFQQPVQQQAPAPQQQFQQPVQQFQQQAPAPVQQQQFQQPVPAPQAAMQQQVQAQQAQAYQQPVQQQAAPMAQAAAQQVPQAAPQAPPSVEEIRQLLGLGFTDQDINGATGVDLTTIAAIRAAG